METAALMSERRETSPLSLESSPRFIDNVSFT